MSGLGKILIIFGAVIVLVGVALLFVERIPWLGRLPGDILIKGKNYTFYFPLASSILFSIVLSIIMYLFFRK